MSARRKASCDELLKWFKDNPNLPGLSLGALTGTDHRALAAAVHLLELYAGGGNTNTLDAFRIVVNQMQPSTRVFAFHAIAFLLDWSDRSRIWHEAGLFPLEQLEGAR
jgi:hypothetical protein